MKYIAVLNKKMPLTSQMNALAHSSLGMPFMKNLPQETFSTFTDKEGTNTSVLTDYPFIILSAKNGNQLRNFHQQLVAANIPCNAFFSNMIDGGTVAEQIATVKQSTLDELEYVAVIAYGSNNDLNPLTKKFSLYRNPNNQ